jgi:hypothetical protein
MFIRIFAFAWIVVCSAAANAFAPPTLTVEYSADRRIETDSGDMQGRVVASPKAQRNETSMQGMTTVMILRTDKKIGWLLMPAQKMYKELDLNKASKQAGAVTPEQTNLELVGQETISGQSANKYKFVMKDKSAGGFLWYTATGIPVKMDVLSKSGGKSTRMTVTLENIQVGPQDPAEFEVPAGYSALSGGGIFGAMGGSASGSSSVSGSKSRGSLFGGGLLGSLKDAVTRPVKDEASAVADDVATTAGAVSTPEAAITGATETVVTEKVKKVGAKATVRGAVQSVAGLFRKR